MRDVRYAVAWATRPLARRTKSRPGKSIRGGRCTCMIRLSARIAPWPELFITTKVMGSPCCAAVQIAWVEYIVDPSPDRAHDAVARPRQGHTDGGA